jgi:hypothetical protein
MTPTGTVRGRILDEDGRPASGAPVQLLHAVYNIYGKTYQPSGHAVANNLGEYLMEGVVPGRYFLLAGSPPVPGSPSQPPWFTRVYFPSASSMEQASMIEVGSDVETSVDMKVPRSGPGHRVRGRAVDGTGSGWPTNPEIILSDGTRDGTLYYTAERTFDRATGLFDLGGVPTGDYTLHVTGNHVGTVQIDLLLAVLEPAAVAPIHVADKDLENVMVTLTRGVAVNGRILVEGEPASVNPNFQQMSLGVGVRPSKVPVPFHRAPHVTTPASDGTFRVAGLRAGAEYRVFLIGNVPGLYLKSIRFSGDDVLSKPLKFSGSAAGEFEVVLARGGLGQIAGNVRDSKSQAVQGALVVAIPLERGQITDYRTAYTDQNGRYTLGDLTPGDYQLFSWESIEDDAFYDPDFLGQYERNGKAVHVAKSSNQSVDVQAIPAP